MAYILRTWNCLNDACHGQFDSGDPAPACPDCGNVRVAWQPGGGNIMSAATKHADRTLKSVAANFGLTNLKSARQGEAAHPGIQQGKPASDRLFHGIPWSTTPTAGFAQPGTRPTVKINAGVQENGAIRTARPARGKLPTKIERTPSGVPMIDNRKVG